MCPFLGSVLWNVCEESSLFSAIPVFTIAVLIIALDVFVISGCIVCFEFV